MIKSLKTPIPEATLEDLSELTKLVSGLNKYSLVSNYEHGKWFDNVCKSKKSFSVDEFIQIINAPSAIKWKPFISDKILFFIDMDFRQTCPATREYFKMALEDGMLIRATALLGGKERIIYIKGISSEKRDYGHPLAYEYESNAAYLIEIEDGKIIKMQKAHTFVHTDLRDMILQKETNFVKYN